MNLKAVKIEALNLYLGQMKTVIQEDGKDRVKVTILFNDEVMYEFHFAFWTGEAHWTAQRLTCTVFDVAHFEAVDAIRKFYKDFGLYPLPDEDDFISEARNVAFAMACRRLWYSTPAMWVVDLDDKVVNIKSKGVIDFSYLRGLGFKPIEMADAKPGHATFPMVF